MYCIIYAKEHLIRISFFWTKTVGLINRMSRDGVAGEVFWYGP